MKGVWVWIASASLAVSMAGALAAQAPALDIKYGLWEMTSASNVSGQMPIDTSNMTAEQKAKIDEAMKATMGAHNNVSKSCVTKEKIEKSVFMMGDQPGMSCSQKITTNTRSSLDASVSCMGRQAMTGQMHVDAASPTSIKGVIKMTSTDQGKTMNVTVNMTGKWLSADCGSEK